MKRTLRCTAKQQAGFTLVELVVVMAVTVILLVSVGFGAATWLPRFALMRQNETARVLFSNMERQLTVCRQTGTLSQWRQALDASQDKTLTLATPEQMLQPIWAADGKACTLESLWPYGRRGRLLSITLTPYDYAAYQAGNLGEAKRTIYDWMLSGLSDPSLLNAAVCVEFSPEAGQVYSVFYCDSADCFTYDASEALPSLRDRSAKARSKYRIGYYGVSCLSVQPEGSAHAVFISNVSLHNDNRLELSFALQGVDAAPLKTAYSIAVCGAKTRQELFCISLNERMTELSAAAIAQKIECSVTVQGDEVGRYSFLAWAEENGRIHLVLDAADLAATSIRLQNHSLATTLSFHRFDALMHGEEEIYCLVSAETPEGQQAVSVKSNDAMVFFAQGSQPGENYNISNGRHLYNLRYLTDVLSENVQTCTLTQSIDWAAFQREGNLYEATLPTDIVQVRSFPSMRCLPENMTLSGNGMTLSNLRIRAEDNISAQKPNLSIFGSDEESSGRAGLVLQNNGMIENLILADCDVRGTDQTGAFCAVSSGQLQNLTLTGESTITGQSMVGGICGENREYGQVIDCAVGVRNMPISVQAAGEGTRLGGVAGGNAGSISGWETYLYVFAELTAEVNCIAGGIVGQQSGTVSYTCFDGRIQGDQAAILGGICGENDGSIQDCSLGEVSLHADQGVLGGVIGTNRGELGDFDGSAATLTAALENGSVGGCIGMWESGSVQSLKSGWGWNLSATGTDGICGGIIGTISCEDALCMLYDCTNYAVVQGNQSGGIIGLWRTENAGLLVQSCRNDGKILGVKVAGILAQADGGSVSVSNCVNTGNLSECGGGMVHTAQDAALTIAACTNIGFDKNGDTHISGMVTQAENVTLYGCFSLAPVDLPFIESAGAKIRNCFCLPLNEGSCQKDAALTVASLQDGYAFWNFEQKPIGISGFSVDPLSWLNAQARTDESENHLRAQLYERLRDYLLPLKELPASLPEPEHLQLTKRANWWQVDWEAVPNAWYYEVEIVDYDTENHVLQTRSYRAYFHQILLPQTDAASVQIRVRAYSMQALDISVTSAWAVASMP